MVHIPPHRATKKHPPIWLATAKGLTRMFKIEKGVPMPLGAGSGPGFPRKYPFAEMEVGDSFFAPGITSRNIAGCFSHASKSGRKFCLRTLTENGVTGVRVWRIA